MKIFVVLLALAISTRAAKYSESRRCIRFLGLVCPTEQDPYCGSDDKTYGNGCLFQQGRCRLEGQLGFKWKGTCEAGEPTTTTLSPCSSLYVCGPEVSHPLCASNGVTYNSYCWFVKARCKKPDLQRLYYGRCEDGAPTTTTHKPFNICDNNFKCPPEKSPLCGTDGKTYENYCIFRKQITCKNINDVTIESSGACVPKTTLSPDAVCKRNQERCLILLKNPAYAAYYNRDVCGSNRVLYNNYCEWEKAHCEDSSITITFPTLCPQKATPTLVVSSTTNKFSKIPVTQSPKIPETQKPVSASRISGTATASLPTTAKPETATPKTPATNKPVTAGPSRTPPVVTATGEPAATTKAPGTLTAKIPTVASDVL